MIQTPEPTQVPAPTETADAADEEESIQLQFEAQEDLSDVMTWTVYDGGVPVTDYHRNEKERIHMPAGDEYARATVGVLTHRSNAFRQNASAGTVKEPSRMKVIWSADTLPAEAWTENIDEDEWTGQPLISKWTVEVRAVSNIREDKKNKKAFKEVIVPGADGRIWFFDLDDGVQTRNPIRTEAKIRGTPSLPPSGYPYLMIGTESADPEQETKGYLEYNLYTQETMSPESGEGGTDTETMEKPAVFSAAIQPIREKSMNRPADHVSVKSSPVFDRISDSVITAGGNGMLYLISLNSYFDYRNAVFRISPTVKAMQSTLKGEEDRPAMVEASAAVYDRYVFYADLAGVLRCVDTDTLTPLWFAETGDEVLSAVALELRGKDGLDLYTANMLSNRENGDAQIRKYNALNGREIWQKSIGVEKSLLYGEFSGFAASPVIGENELSSLVYYTVTGLNGEGRKTLNAADGTGAALIALDKETGEIRWIRELGDRCISSPAAVYDKDGNGWIVQCRQDGTILLLEGLTGRETASLTVRGRILSSPAIYNNTIVVRTTGDSTGTVYGISIQAGYWTD